ncbi:MAG: GNAT family protein [Myxococcota bacterium]|nr:GNAT family protein [Myxococcota bacterium]
MPTDKPAEIATDGTVRIRRIDLTDVDTIFAGVCDSMAALSPIMPWASPDYSREDACWFVANAWLGWRDGRAYGFLVEDVTDGRFLGLCGLNEVSGHTANLGYWVTTAEAGRGVTTAATRLVARFGFEQAGLKRIRLFHIVGNVGSRRVAEKVGFVYEGLCRQHLAVHGTIHDTRLYSLTSAAEIKGKR